MCFSGRYVELELQEVEEVDCLNYLKMKLRESYYSGEML
jgi:hypothetical protein